MAKLRDFATRSKVFRRSKSYAFSLNNGIVKRRRRRVGQAGGFFRFEAMKGRNNMHGAGYGDFIRLRDEFGNVWRGEADVQSDDIVRYRFRDSNGNIISGISDSYGIILRDEHGNTWRGFVD
jgi:hypothetical protein